MPLNHEKERCRAKAKAKAKVKAIRTSFFFGLDVFFGVAYLFLSSNIGHFFFSIIGQWQLIRTGPNVCCVPVLISGNAVRVGSSDEPRIRSPD
jgi:hypothetical protein